VLVFVLFAVGGPQSGDRLSSHAAEKEPVTAKITLGPHEGTATPTKVGHAKTGDGTIEVSQPAPDTLVVRMNGSAAASGSPFCSASAMFDFLEEQQFQVEFSQPDHVGQLILQAELHGLLVCHGKMASAGMPTAVVSVFSGPQELGSLPLPERMVHGKESAAVHLSQGPVCMPIPAGCYGLRQQFRISAVLLKGCCLGGRALAEFSPSALPSFWQGSGYPFEEVDKQNLGYTVTLRAVPADDAAADDVAVDGGPYLSRSFAAPPPTQAAIAPATLR
jgi:hypothetical protein